MARWLVNSVSTPWLALLFVGGAMLVAATGQLLVRRYLQHATRGEHNEVAGVMVTVIVAVYGVLLGFVIVSLYESYNDAKKTTQVEAASLEDLLRDSALFSPAAHRAIERFAGDYAKTVVNEEWNLLAHGKSSPRVSADLGELFAIVQGFNPERNSTIAWYWHSLDDLHAIHFNRHERLNESHSTIPAPLWALLWAGAIVVLAFAYFFGLRSARAQMAMVVLLGAMLGFTLFVALVLDYPFSGGIRIPSIHFREGDLAQFFPHPEG